MVFPFVVICEHATTDNFLSAIQIAEIGLNSFRTGHSEIRKLTAGFERNSSKVKGMHNQQGWCFLRCTCDQSLYSRLLPPFYKVDT